MTTTTDYFSLEHLRPASFGAWSWIYRGFCEKRNSVSETAKTFDKDMQSLGPRTWLSEKDILPAPWRVLIEPRPAQDATIHVWESRGGMPTQGLNYPIVVLIDHRYRWYSFLYDVFVEDNAVQATAIIDMDAHHSSLDHTDHAHIRYRLDHLYRSLRRRFVSREIHLTYKTRVVHPITNRVIEGTWDPYSSERVEWTSRLRGLLALSAIGPRELDHKVLVRTDPDRIPLFLYPNMKFSATPGVPYEPYSCGTAKGEKDVANHVKDISQVAWVSSRVREACHRYAHWKHYDDLVTWENGVYPRLKRWCPYARPEIINRYVRDACFMKEPFSIEEPIESLPQRRVFVDFETVESLEHGGPWIYLIGVLEAQDTEEDIDPCSEKERYRSFWMKELTVEEQRRVIDEFAEYWALSRRDGAVLFYYFAEVRFWKRVLARVHYFRHYYALDGIGCVDMYPIAFNTLRVRGSPNHKLKDMSTHLFRQGCLSPRISWYFENTPSQDIETDSGCFDGLSSLHQACAYYSCPDEKTREMIECYNYGDCLLLSELWDVMTG